MSFNSAKDWAKAAVVTTVNPVKGTKDQWAATKEGASDAKNMFKPPAMPGPTAQQLALERQQREAITTLDSQENMRRKRLLNAMQGLRAFTGSALFRSQANAAPGAASTAASSPVSTMPSGVGGGRVFTGGTPSIFQP